MAVYQPVLTLFLLVRVTVQQSYHHHSHIHDPPETPYYKYSRAANEKGWVHQDHHEHTHIHDSEDIHHGGQFHKEDDRFHEHLFTKEGNVYKPYDPNGPLSFLNDFRIRLWVYSIGSTLLISIVPFLLLSLIPIQTNTVKNEPLLKILLSFGSGGLLGDAFLHLIPHAQPDDHHGYSHLHQHAHAEHLVGSHGMGVGGYVLSGIITFLTVEKIVRILRSNQILQSHSHSHSHGNIMPAKDMQKHEKSNDNTELDREKKSDVSSAEESSYAHSDHESEPLMEKKTDSETGFKIAAYLNIVADFAHNFTDGLAIGASYLAGTTVGVVTMVTVLLHEVPHEIGDFAILVQSGFSKKRAMFMQLLTACGALSGCMLSLCAADPNELSNSPSSSWVLPFTAGGFIYIATVSVIPELLESTSTWQSIKEVIALLTGILLMYLIAVFE